MASRASLFSAILTEPVEVIDNDPNSTLSPAAEPRSIPFPRRSAVPRTCKDAFALSVICPLFALAVAVRSSLTVKLLLLPKLIAVPAVILASFCRTAVESIVAELTVMNGAPARLAALAPTGRIHPARRVVRAPRPTVVRYVTVTTIRPARLAAPAPTGRIHPALRVVREPRPTVARYVTGTTIRPALWAALAPTGRIRPALRVAREPRPTVARCVTVTTIHPVRLAAPVPTGRTHPAHKAALVRDRIARI